MKALSVRQPWAWLIVNGYKDVENRTWIPNLGPCRLAIHASKTFDARAFAWIFSTFPHLRDEMPPGKHSYNRGGIVGIVGYLGWVSRADTWHDSDWFTGPYGWILKDPRVIDFMPYRGQLGLFDVELDGRAASGR